MPALTAILIAYNEELDLPRALASLQGVADETILVDSGSTDRTCEIAREFGVWGAKIGELKKKATAAVVDGLIANEREAVLAFLKGAVT